MNPISPYLSIWELAHRWHDAMPSPDGHESITLEIRDTIGALLGAALDSQLAIFEELVGSIGEENRSQTASVFVIPLDTPPPEFEQMYLNGIYDRGILAYYRVSLAGVFYWAVNSGFSVPDFCIPDEVRSRGTPLTIQPRTRPEAEDRARCQEIASRKWVQSPGIRIAEMARDPEIRIEGNGGLYAEPTLLRWLR